MSERESSRGRIMRFRGWSYTDNAWMSPSTIEVWDNTGILKAFYGGDYVIEQWTGVTDSKGVDIYEGDIVRYTRRGGIVDDNGIYVAPVTWHGLGFALVRPDSGRYPDLLADDWRILSREVLGNIHEHPHLLQS